MAALDARAGASEALRESRVRTVTWEDPVAVMPEAYALSGWERLERGIAGDLPTPPFLRLLGLAPGRVERGFMTLVTQPAEYHCGPAAVSGGLAATMLDTAMGLAVETLLPAGVGLATLDMHVQFARPVTLGIEHLEGEGRVVHEGSRIMRTSGRLVDGDDREYAYASATFMVLGDLKRRERSFSGRDGDAVGTAAGR